MERKEFLKNICLFGTCLTGFGQISHARVNEKNDVNLDEGCLLQRTWISEMLNQLDTMDMEAVKKALKNMASIHYRQLQMDKMLEPYIHDLQGFIDFIEKEWGWKVSMNESERTLIADENKDHCVCPMIDPKISNSSLMCHCSEGFAEMMFSKIISKKVSAVVISSILRGDKSCKYKITYP